MNKYLSLALAFPFFLTSCSDESQSSANYLANLEIQVLRPENSLFAEVALDSLAVIVTNTSDQNSRTTYTNEQGIAQVTGVTAGTYNISTSTSFEQYTLAASANNVVVARTETKMVELDLIGKSTAKDLIIKQIYYLGCKDYAVMFRDQFIELYNNTSEVIYADGLYIGGAAGNTTGAQANDNIMYGEGANQLPLDEYIYLQRIMQIPGNGTDHPVEPGKSLVIALNGVDYTASYNPGGSYLETDYVNLSGADFEMSSHQYLMDKGYTPSSPFDVDNVDIPNMTIKYMSIVGDYNFYQFNTSGPSLVLFRLDGELDLTDVVIDPTSTSNNDDDKQRFVRISAKKVIDGAECLYSPASAAYKRLPKGIDLGFTYSDKEGSKSYTSIGVRRKVAFEQDGRKILVDTNNSTNDFEPVYPPKPFEF